MSHKKDLTNQIFTRLIALEIVDSNKHGRIVWKCQCSCGNIIYVNSNNLQSGKIRSCGCLRKENAKRQGKANQIDLMNQKFGRLVVIESTETRSGDHVVWKCLCVCGNIAYVSSGNLVGGNTISCGCYNKDRLSEIHTTHGLSKTREYQNTQNKKHKEMKKIYDSEWSVKMENALHELFSVCIICGITREEHYEKYGVDLHIDHVQPLSKGYGLKPGNAVILCAHHNARKNAKTLDKLPQDWQYKILNAAKEFEEYWLKF